MGRFLLPLLLLWMGGTWAQDRWVFQQGAFSLQLIQRTPDQTRAFFQARGFSPTASDQIAEACVLQAILRNEGEVPLRVDLRPWRVLQDGQEQPIPVAQSWRSRWEALQVALAAQIAFRWALFPTQQRFFPGDQAWGMIPFGPAPGTVFNLLLMWKEDQIPRQGHISGIRCPADPVILENADES